MFLKRLLLFCIITPQLIVIIWLGTSIIQKIYNKNVLGVTNVSQLHKKNLSFPNDPTLQYYYESAPNTTQEDQPIWLPEKVIYTINSDGFNERYEYSVNKPPNTFRILTLGDSFTFGHYVSTVNNWPEQLEDMLNSRLQCKNQIKFEVINLGEPGYDIQYVTHRYKTKGKKYSPDLLIWLEPGKGFDRFNELKGPYEKKREQELENAGQLNDLADYTRAYKMAEHDVHEAYSQSELDALVDAWWQNFLVIKGETPLIVTTYTDEIRPHIVRLQQYAQSTTYMYISKAITGRNEDKFTLPDGHPNANGHAQIASDTFTLLNNLGLLPCE